jgi:hypothetical protein
LARPDPEKALVLRLRDQLPRTVTVGTRRQSGRPIVVVSIRPGGRIRSRAGRVDDIPTDLECIGDAALSSRDLASLVRDAVEGGWTVSDQRVLVNRPDPPYQLPDPSTDEDRRFVPTTVSCYPLA